MIGSEVEKSKKIRTDDSLLNVGNSKVVLKRLLANLDCVFGRAITLDVGAISCF